MSYIRLWLFEAAAGREPEFVAAYGPEGDWARLFRRSPGFLRTDMVRRDPAGAIFLVTDHWVSRRDWDDFLAAHGEDYRALDHALAKLCASETKLDEGEIP